MQIHKIKLSKNSLYSVNNLMPKLVCSGILTLV